MGKGKLAKFADMERYANVFQCPYSVIGEMPLDMKGKWRELYFHNDNPITLELGCDKGEYTVNLAHMYPDTNFIGVDIKGARMWTGATQALNENLTNAAFLRTNIEIIDFFFDTEEVNEIWLTFPDPQMKNPRKRLTSTGFLNRYRKFLIDNGVIHLKTDSAFLFTYTKHVVGKNDLPQVMCTDDLYHAVFNDVPVLETLHIQTYYEKMWIDRGLNIKYLEFRLPHKGILSEPDVEIETDDYRSYHRVRRSPAEKSK